MRTPATLAAALGLLLLSGTGLRAQERTVYERDSPYQRIIVTREGSVFTLQFGRIYADLRQSQVDVNRPDHHQLEYSTLCMAGLLYQPTPKRALVLGLGGGVIPRELRRCFPDLEIDIAEIDADVPKVAEQFFGFRTDARLRVHVVDGRPFIRRRLLETPPPPKYDLIVLDAFNHEYIPFHLTTKEFLHQVRQVLNDDGVVVANVFHTNRFFDAELKTFFEVFGRCETYTGRRSVNAILCALGKDVVVPDDAALLARANELQARHRFTFDLPAIARRRVVLLPRPGAEALTDDKAPVDWLRRQPVARELAPEVVR